MSKNYKLMIYFAHSTLVMYSKTIVSNIEMTAGEFMEQNKDVVKRVCAESLTIMNYELSHIQITKACLIYLQCKYYPVSVEETEIFTIQK